ncbi:MAG: 2OG-Fe(II) oxygenase family protein [Actinomycetota bacterium]
MVPLVSLESAEAPTGLAEALARYGFVELTDHGLDPAVLSRLRLAVDAFFSLPTEVKVDYVHPDPLANRGYRPKGSEALAYSLGQDSLPDLFESFNAGRDQPTAWTDLIQPTPWPDEHVPDYRPAAQDALAEFQALGRRLDTLIGRMIEVPDLAACSVDGPDMLACIDYRPGPDGTEAVADGQLRMGAHSDYTTYTLLLADPVPGLQIVAPDGTWVDVIPTAGNLLLNVGDLLAMWTNDTWPSTLHRVVPMAEGAAAHRRSVAWFHYPDPDVVVSPRSAFVASGSPRYKPVRVDDHVRGKLGAPKTGDAPTSSSTQAGRHT